jgi:prepilin signal peptidase PulO-like enzyme (type II secretory pathway)
LVVIFLLGTILGSLANWAIYRLAWFSRPISPWSRPSPVVPQRHLYDRLPILGWLGLRREAGMHGMGFWIRPMLLELLVGVGLAWLYWWETVAARLIFPTTAEVGALGPDNLLVLHLEFASHCVLIGLMLAASMIDVDEKIIPDEVTIPGTLLGLLIAAIWPSSLLPDIIPPGVLGFVHVASPNNWPEWLSGFPLWESLAMGLACWWAWCVALLPRTWYIRHGWRRAMQLSMARIARQRSTYRILRMAVMGTIAIALVWYRGVPDWQGLFSSLVGMAAAGGLVWLVRIIGSAALHREAMGFGDVTLMAMIGAFVGWQACIVIFFLAPFAGLLVGVFRLVLFRDKEIPYGPFLCLATLGLIVFWFAIWNYVLGVFSLGWIVPLLMLGCLALMAIMLATWRMIVNICRRIA